jgi:hypothetical protein
LSDLNYSILEDYLIDIKRKRINDKNVYTIPFWLGRVPGMAIELALATDCEWTYIAGKNCTQESGCSHGVYDHHMTSSEKVNWTLMYSTVSPIPIRNLTQLNPIKYFCYLSSDSNPFCYY